ncbi:MAG TPA: DUF4157 domain-containing protein [Kofleriaceae bacterium]|jgi:hypothetical protein|nr:DUF4157 domain-containing protein [Kofleriaceae bacterium]
MNVTKSRQSLVLQGYFRAEQFRGTARKAGASQPVDRADWAAKAPRPDLMPGRARSETAQARPAAQPGASWPGAPRPDLLPGMGRPRSVAQPRSSPGISSTPIPPGQLRVIGEGRPLDPGIRQAMESFFQADFSGVRVHEGPAAQAMGALAFTVGDEIHFAPGLYDPTSRNGVALLGHELTHVLQQRDGRVANPYGQGVAIVQDPALETEADRMGQRLAEYVGSRPDAVPAGRSHHPARLALRPGASSKLDALLRSTCSSEPRTSWQRSTSFPVQLAASNINQLAVDWNSSNAGPVACRDLRLRHTIEFTNKLVNSKEENPSIESTDIIGPTLRNYAWFELTDTNNNTTYTGVAASSGGSDGLHAERSAYRYAIENLLKARGVTEKQMMGPGNNPLMWESVTLNTKQIRITAAYTERSLCRDCQVWLESRLSLGLTVEYSFEYTEDGRTILKSDYRMYVKDWLERELDEQELTQNLDWLQRFNNRHYS